MIEDIKKSAYADLVDWTSARWGQLDSWPVETWDRFVQLDEWLVQYRADARVSVEQYVRNCRRLLALFDPPEVEGKAERKQERAA